MSPDISREDLLAELQRLASELGKTPTKREMDDNGAYSGQVYIRQFGSWNAAVEEVDLEPDSRGGGNHVTDEDLLEELQRLAAELGRTPTMREMDEKGKFSARTYTLHFKSWNAALEKVSLEPNSTGTEPKQQRIIQQLQEAEQ